MGRMTAAADPRVKEVGMLFMSVYADPSGPPKSFEEQRVDDYLSAYRTTGRPPHPCPPEPSDVQQRAAQGLPPLFIPYHFVDNGTSAEPPSAVSERTEPPPPTVSDPRDLPPVQIFQPTSVNGESDVYHCISFVPRFDSFSPEELRYHAYLKGVKYASPGELAVTLPLAKIAPQNADSKASPVAATSPLFSKDTYATSYASLKGSPSGVEHLMSISAGTNHVKHSLEELRISFLESGRELTSAEIIQYKSPSGIGLTTPPPSSASSIFGSSSNPLSQAPTVRPF